ncbi:MAG: hypothetical protein ACRDOY_09695 [Nocardioidaceae bacterium]
MTTPAPPRWVYTHDLAHVLTDGGDDAGNGLPAFLTLCGLGVATTTPVYRAPPSLDMCRMCVPLPGDDRPAPPDPPDVPPPTFPSTPTTF